MQSVKHYFCRVLSVTPLVYDLGIRLYHIGAWGASFFDKKARLWIEGRKAWKDVLTNFNWKDGKRIWFHCASLGEFEQARPLIEKIKQEIPDCTIILTFFSPSGYEVRKSYVIADLVLYLPLDTETNAKDFVSLVQPDLALFVKYEFWFHFLKELKRNQIPVVLFSATFRNEQVFFKSYAGVFREMLGLFSHIFVQTEDSRQLLLSIDAPSEVAFDTRFDRVTQVARDKKPFPLIEKFKTNSKIFIAGSTWQKDESLVLRCIHDDLLKEYKYIIAPHQVEPTRLNELKKRIKVKAVLYSELTEQNAIDADVIIIDNIGNLSSLYAFGDIAYIGGGFDAGVHNVLEAAVYGMPILFGPKHNKSEEALELKKEFAAFDISSFQELKYTLETLTTGDMRRVMYATLRSKQYVKSHLGGTNLIFDQVQKLLEAVPTQ